MDSYKECARAWPYLTALTRTRVTRHYVLSALACEGMAVCGGELTRSLSGMTGHENV